MIDIEDQLVDLQTRVAYQENTLEQLNDVLAQQDADIIQLKQQIRLLAQSVEEMQGEQGAGDAEVVEERPPHY